MSTPGGEKPYRVYRGGRQKGRVPTVGRPEKSPSRAKAERDGRSNYRGPGPKATARRPRQIRWGRELTIALVLVVAFFLAWSVIGYLVFRSGVSEANKRLPQNARRALAPDQGSLLSTPTAILLLGTDHSLAAARAGDRHSDSITLLPTGSTTFRSRATCASRSPATAARRSTRPSRSAARASPRARSRPTPTSRSTTSSSSTSPSSKT
jgi:hypothetical protein